MGVGAETLQRRGCVDMAHKCCSRECDGDEECTVAFLCDKCNEPIDIEEEYYDVDGLKLCEDCFDDFAYTKYKRIAYR